MGCFTDSVGEVSFGRGRFTKGDRFKSYQVISLLGETSPMLPLCSLGEVSYILYVKLDSLGKGNGFSVVDRVCLPPHIYFPGI